MWLPFQVPSLASAKQLKIELREIKNKRCSKDRIFKSKFCINKSKVNINWQVNYVRSSKFLSSMVILTSALNINLSENGILTLKTKGLALDHKKSNTKIFFVVKTSSTELSWIKLEDKQPIESKLTTKVWWKMQRCTLSKEKLWVLFKRSKLKINGFTCRSWN